MKLLDFDYSLPAELIAQEPLEERDGARLLVHDVRADRTEHRRVLDLVDHVEEGDLMVVNDTRVLPSRLFGRRRSGGRVELLLIERADHAREARADPSRADWIWSAMVNPARKLKPGEILELEGGRLHARMLARPASADGRPAAEWLVELLPPDDEGDVLAVLERHGHVPLPPYIQRDADGSGDEADRERYQTVYAERPGAVAAPTAGLHFTPELFARLERRGVRRVAVTLHVGPGTFRPVQCENVEEHRMHSERFELSPAVAQAVDETRERGRRVIAVGTTSVRVLEACAVPGDATRAGGVQARTGETSLFLRPGSTFRVVDALMTNFHLPRSSLLLLVCAFAGRERVLRLYGEAIERRYRFYSYGDAMFLHAAR